MKARDALVAVSGNRRLTVAIAACAAALLLFGAALSAARASAAPPTATIDPVGTVSMTTAQVSGEIDPADTETSYCFETSTDSVNWSGFCFAGSVPAGAGSTPVTQELTGLKAGQEYKVRLTAQNFTDPEAFSSEETFTTDPLVNTPSVSLDPADFSYTTAKLEGSFNPNGGNDDSVAGTLPIAWELQTSESGDPGTWGYANGGVLEGAEAKGTDPIDVSADLSGLAPSTTVHYRLLVVHGGNELIAGPDQLTTLAVTAPSVTIDPVTDFTGTTAHFSGSINPNAPGPEPQDPAFDVSWRFECTPDCGAPSGATVPAGDQTVSVEADANLKPNTDYSVVLVASNASGEARSAPVQFTTDVVLPAVHKGVPSMRAGLATLRGYVEARNSEVTDCHFEYGPTDSYGNSAPCSPASPGANRVQRVAIRATAGTFRLSIFGKSTKDIPFDASATQVETAIGEAFPSLPTGSFSVGGGPGDEGGTNPYEIRLRSGFQGKTILPFEIEDGSVPLSGGNAPSSVTTSPNDSPLVVTADVSGLEPGTYHYKLVAGNGIGAVETDDRTFTSPEVAADPSCPNPTAPGAGFLPECRAYEMVSPPDKEGTDVAAISVRTRAASAGDAASFTTLKGFGDAVGTGVGVDYLSRRSTDPEPSHNGWTTHAIQPRERGTSITGIFSFLDPFYVGEFSADLSTGVYYSNADLTGDPDVGNVTNLYLRDDLLSPGQGHYDLLTKCPGCAGTPLTAYQNKALALFRRPTLVGSTPDFGRIYFESIDPLVAGTTFSGSARLFEAAGGEVELVGRIPDAGIACDDSGAPGATPCVNAPNSITGAGGGESSPKQLGHVISDESDGHSRVFFTRTLGSPASMRGNVYMRVDGRETVKLNASEEPTSEPAPAKFWDASADGTRAFLSSTERLTPDTPAGSGFENLYMYDATKPPSAPDNLTLVSVDGEPADFGGSFAALLGVGGQGHYAYFIGTSQMVPGRPAPELGEALYVWHDGSISEIGLTKGQPELFSSGPNPILNPRQARVTPDGERLYFAAMRGQDLTGFDHGSCETAGCRQLYVYDAVADELQCASCPPGDGPGSEPATMVVREAEGGTNLTSHESRTITADGRLAFFSTPEALVPEDTNGQSDAYAYDTETATPRLLSSGTDPSDSYFLEVTPDGSNAFFVTRERLVGWDTDGAYDLYDARVEGGFPEPVAVTAPCSGESCQGPMPPAPGVEQPGTVVFAGPPDRKPKRPGCVKRKQGKGKRGGKCARKGQAKKRNADKNRRASR